MDAGVIQRNEASVTCQMALVASSARGSFDTMALFEFDFFSQQLNAHFRE